LSIFNAILDALPQTQCGQCGFPGCRPYAAAIVANQAAINLCPPGGIKTLKKLGQLTNQTTEPLEATLTARIKSPHIVVVREDECIGCTKCLQACPVDAIYGAAKQMHVVLSEKCTGCELCIDPCPMDCIDLIEVSQLHYDKQTAREAYEAKLARHDFKRAGMTPQEHQALAPPIIPTLDRKRFIAEAVARAKAKK
jgi:electron transport complex protein RnfB